MKYFKRHLVVHGMEWNVVSCHYLRKVPRLLKEMLLYLYTVSGLCKLVRDWPCTGSIEFCRQYMYGIRELGSHS